MASAAAGDDVYGGVQRRLHPCSAVGGGRCPQEEEKSKRMREKNGEEERSGAGV
jgi:hypothetical protein